LVIIICAICQRAISSNNSPTYFCSQCEQTFHASCEKGKILHKTEKSEGPLDDDYVCLLRSSSIAIPALHCISCSSSCLSLSGISLLLLLCLVFLLTIGTYVCSSCTQLNQTIPYGNDHSIAASILQEQVDTVQPNCYNSGYNHLQVTATAIVQKQNMVNGTNNLYPKYAVDIVQEETHSNSGLALYQLFIELSFSVRYIFAFIALFSFSFNHWYFWISFFLYYVYCIFWVEIICPI
jgi:hypothetical protein